MDRDKAPANPSNLRDNAVSSVTSAISRGRKRRANRRNVAAGEIQIGRTTTASAQQLAERGAPSVTKRRRTSLIPCEESDLDEDSNDEWEEHVDMDEDKVAAAVASRQTEKEKANRLEKLNAAEAEQSELPADEPVPPDAEELAKARKERARRRAAAARKKVLRRHALHILLSVAHLQRLDAAAVDDEVRGFAMSMLPEDAFLSKDNFEESLSRFALWLRAEFRLTADAQVRGDKGTVACGNALCSAAERAVACSRDSCGDVMDLLTVVAALVRDQGFRCRIVSPVQPIAHQAPKKTTKTHKVTGKVRVIDKRADDFEAVIYGWVEVLCPKTSRWIPMDVCEGQVCVEEPMQVIRNSIARILLFDGGKSGEPKEERASASSSKSRRRLRQRKPVSKEDLPARKLSPSLFCHVVALENGFHTDVTRRYVRNWKDVDKARAKGRVFERILEALQEKGSSHVQDEARKVEIAEFDALSAEEALPTSISALHKHPRYILERHLKKYEFIHPKFPILGHLKDEPIYLRSNVHLLHTKDRWIRQMRVVAEDAKPLKSVRSMNGTDATVDLFGKWQTEPLEIPPCVNGIVPKGIHGNVDLWSPEHLPKGTVHITMPCAKAAARKLGLDCAPAMTGFEIRGGRSVPKIDGIVVAVENADVVRDAARSTAAVVAERQEAKARMEACERWLKVFRAVSAREKVRKKYGGMFQDAGTYEAKQKREGLRKAREEKYGGREPDAGKGSKTGPVNQKAKASTDAHEHVYGEASCVEGDIWVKTCVTCGLELSFEKL